MKNAATLPNYLSTTTEAMHERNDAILSGLQRVFSIETKEDVLSEPIAEQLYSYVKQHAINVATEMGLEDEISNVIKHNEQLPIIRINNRLTRSTGRYIPNRHTIEVSGQSMKYYTVHDVLSTLLHEMAHAVIGEYPRHGDDGDEYFEALLYRIGADSSGHLPRDMGEVPVYVYETDGCDCVFYYERRTNLNGYTCLEHKNEINPKAIRMTYGEYKDIYEVKQEEDAS